MSREDVDVGLAFTAAYNAGDLETAVGLCVPDVVATPDASVYLESSPRVGRAGLRSILEESRSVWENCAHTPEEVLDIGDGRVLIRGDWGGEGTVSGIETFQSLSALFTVRDGRISKVEWFFDHAKALEAVGRAG